MGTEQDLIQKLMISKKIMDKHTSIPRSGSNSINMDMNPELAEFSAPQAKYNIPSELMMESKPITVPPQVSPRDKILSSKLPDEIKRLMIEHPIVQPNSTQAPSISNELVEKATRLMNVDAAGKEIRKSNSQQVISQPQSIDNSSIKQMIRETIEEVLSENGLLVESVSKSNDLFTFKVGKHVFEGKLTKIKKLK